MRAIRRRVGFLLCALVMLAAAAGDGRAGYIAGGGGLNGLGTYSGQVEYSATDAGTATLTVELWNTSPSAGGGFLTAFAFDAPADRVTGATVSSTNPNFQLLGEPGTSGGVHAPPFGAFDLGASTSGAFLGGGSPRGGIGVGESATFVFALSGHGLDGLTEESFFGGAPGEIALVARFRGFNNGGSDKVPGGLVAGPPPPGSGDVPGGPEVPVPPPGSVPPAAPEPGALALAGIAAAAGLGYGRRASRGNRPRAGAAL